MSNLLNNLNLLNKTFDVDALYATWTTDAPVFKGGPKDDPVAWLSDIKAGMRAHKVPKEHWPRVAHHYMAPKPKARIDELGRVLQQMTGKQNVWDWKRFKVAVQNIGCEYFFQTRVFFLFALFAICVYAFREKML